MTLHSRPSAIEPPRTWRLPALGLLLAVSLPGLCGCGIRFSEHRGELSSYHATGRYEYAAQMLDDPGTQRLYGAKNEVLWQLDRGAIALATGDHERAIELLESAERTIEIQRQASLGDVLGRWTVNDAAAKYIAEPYEDIYLNVIKLLAQLSAGRIEGGATVEARRLGGKADSLRDLYLKYDDAVSSQGRRRVGTRTASLVAVNEEGHFVESPLGTFLAAVTFLKSGEREFQRVAARRLVDSIGLQSGVIGPVREEDFQGLDELRAEDVNVLVVAFSGRGPTKYAERIGPIPLGTIPVYFELPRLRTHPSGVAAASIELDSGEGEPLRLVENLGLVAAENHRRSLPLIYRRTLLRYMMKAGLSVAATEAMRRGASDRDQGAVQLAGVLIGLGALAATERADLRAWAFLPGQAHVGLLKLPPGRHRGRVVYQSAIGGAAHASEWRSFDVSDDGLATIVTHYWR